MMNPVPWLQMTNMISYQGLVRTFPSRGKGHEQDNGLKYARLAVSQLGKENDQGASSLVLKLTSKATWSWNVDR